MRQIDAEGKGKFGRSFWNILVCDLLCIGCDLEIVQLAVSVQGQSSWLCADAEIVERIFINRWFFFFNLNGGSFAASISVDRNVATSKVLAHLQPCDGNVVAPGGFFAGASCWRHIVIRCTSCFQWLGDGEGQGVVSFIIFVFDCRFISIRTKRCICRFICGDAGWQFDIKSKGKFIRAFWNFYILFESCARREGEIERIIVADLHIFTWTADCQINKLAVLTALVFWIFFVIGRAFSCLLSWRLEQKIHVSVNLNIVLGCIGSLDAHGLNDGVNNIFHGIWFH